MGSTIPEPSKRHHPRSAGCSPIPIRSSAKPRPERSRASHGGPRPRLRRTRSRPGRPFLDESARRERRANWTDDQMTAFKLALLVLLAVVVGQINDWPVLDRLVIALLALLILAYFWSK